MAGDDRTRREHFALRVALLSLGGAVATAPLALAGEPAPIASDADSVARAIATSDLEIARSLTLGALTTWDRRERDGSLTSASRDLAALAATLPERATGKIELRAGQRTRPLATLALPDARDVEGRERNGVVWFASAYPDVDVLWTASESTLEELLLLRTPTAQTSFELELDLRVDIVGTKTEPSGATLFLDAEGRGVLRLLPAYAIDRRGVRRDAGVEVAMLSSSPPHAHIRVSLDTAGLSFPVLLDPPLEVVTWTQLQPAESPPARAEAAAAFDSDRGRVVLHGGAPSNPAMTLDDTWEWDGMTWANVTPQIPGPARSLHTLVYDPVAKQTVLFGDNATGNGMTGITDTWSWDGTSWTSHGLPGPGPRMAPSMTYDTGRSRLVMFGGTSGPNADNQTWELPENASMWTNLTPVSRPTPRWGAAFVYDSMHGVSVMFGGQNPIPSGAYYADTNLWDGTMWTGLLTPGPSARAFGGAAFDSARGVTVIFAGEQVTGSVPTLFGDTWEWDGASWTMRSTSTSPSPRGGPAMTFDSTRKEVVMFGGASIVNSVGAVSAETWVYRSPGGTCKTSTDCEGSSCVDGVCCGQPSCGVCESCAVPGQVGVCSALTSTDDPDSCTGMSTCDSTGACRAKAGQTCASATDCATGFCAAGICCDRACDGRCDACAVASGASVDGTCAELPKGAPGTPSCAPYLCGGSDDCAASCQIDADCATGSRCASGACVPAQTITMTPVAHCKDVSTLIGADGASKACAPYLCAAGACGTMCSTSDDCATGNACASGSRCVPASTPPASSDGSCAITTGHRQDHTWAIGLAAFASVVWVHRRRRQAKAHA